MLEHAPTACTSSASEPQWTASSRECDLTSEALEDWIAAGLPEMTSAQSDRLVSMLTSSVAYSTLLDLIFGRRRHAALRTSRCPPGCEGLPEDEWDECDDEPPKKSDVERSRKKGRALSLMKAWLQHSWGPDSVDLKQTAAARVALDLIPASLRAVGKSSGSEALDAVRMLVATKLGNAPDACKDIVLDALLVLLTVRKLVLPDLLNRPEDVWRMRLPIMHDKSLRRYDDCWWDSFGFPTVDELLPGMGRHVSNDIARLGKAAGVAGLAATSALAAAVLHDCSGRGISSSPDVTTVESLVQRMNTHPLSISEALPALARAIPVLDTGTHTTVQLLEAMLASKAMNGRAAASVGPHAAIGASMQGGKRALGAECSASSAVGEGGRSGASARISCVAGLDQLINQTASDVAASGANDAHELRMVFSDLPLVSAHLRGMGVREPAKSRRE